jgi:hypothetical protein
MLIHRTETIFWDEGGLCYFAGRAESYFARQQYHSCKFSVLSQEILKPTFADKLVLGGTCWSRYVIFFYFVLDNIHMISVCKKS